MKRTKLKNIRLMVLVVALVGSIGLAIWSSRVLSGIKQVKPVPTGIRPVFLEKGNRTMLLGPDFRSVFCQTRPDPIFTNINMLSKVHRFGVSNRSAKILRTLRFQNITRAVEHRYGLPDNLLLAMILEESNGVDLLPNGLGDGGFGLVHMQCATASEFGLKTYNGCAAMVDHEAHAGLSTLIDKNPDRKVLMEYDQRLSPIMNIDAAGRMLTYYMVGPRIRDLDALRTAIARYAGSHNYRAYLRDVVANMKDLSNPAVIGVVRHKFNLANPKLLVNGKPGGFDAYIRASQEQAENYGLSDYKKLPRYVSEESKETKATIARLLK